MNSFFVFSLKALRKVYAKAFLRGNNKPECEQDADKASKVIYDALVSDKPYMIARFGSTELACLVNYLGIKNDEGKYVDYIRGKSNAWWWNPKNISQMQLWSGFFPSSEQKIEQFCELLLKDMVEVNVLGSWIPNEVFIKNRIANAIKVSLPLLEPYTSSNPWSRALSGKKVLVVHPFASLIEKQYTNRELLFTNQEVLPEFDLKVIKAVQSLGGDSNGFADWFEALEWMKAEIDTQDYDICLIGCGAYGFHLAAHVKRTGKKAVHLGGALQLLFGIKGNRWEVVDYASKWGLPKELYLDMFKNEYWIKPTDDLKPKTADKVEGACYW